MADLNNQTNNLDEVARATGAARELGLELARIDESVPTKEALEKVEKKLVLEYRLVPLFIKEKSLYLAVADPSLLSKPAPSFLQDLKKAGYKLVLYITPQSDFEMAVKAYDQIIPKPSKLIESQLGQSVKPQTAPPAMPIAPSAKSGQLPTVNLKFLDIPKKVLNLFPKDVAQKYQIIVFRQADGGKEVHVGAVNPTDEKVKEIIKYIETKNNKKVVLYQADYEGFLAALDKYDGASVSAGPKLPPTSRTQIDEIKKASIATPPLSKPTSPAPTPPVSEPSSSIPKPPLVADQAPMVEMQMAPADAVKTETKVEGFVAPGEEKNLNKVAGEIQSSADLEGIAKSGLVPKMIAGVVLLASKMEASDIHIEAQEEVVRVRYRIDGTLKEIIRLPLATLAPMVSRIKILSKLKIDETRLPQDGRFDVEIDNREVDIRVSTLPSVRGEKVVMRLLDKEKGLKTLEQLGLNGTNMERIQKALTSPYGIILVTGPTGSGKTTTLYAGLTQLNTAEVNIVTLEDPVEYQLEGINQTQINPKIGYTFADGLRSIVRQDPNIIMVGEIRDSETATLATQAALTGHLVLSTLHTNNAAGALPRMIDMDVEPFLLTSSINVIIAQRLLRKLCEKCKAPAEVNPETIQTIKSNLESSKAPEIQSLIGGEFKFYKAVGCEGCDDGYKGRVGAFEVLGMTEAMGQLTLKKASSTEMHKKAVEEGMVTLYHDGIAKALQGLTTLDEVLSLTRA